MKRSSIILLSLLSVIIVTAVVCIMMIRNKIPYISYPSPSHYYTMVITSADSSIVDNCNIKVITSDEECDSLVVNYINRSEAVSTICRNDTVFVVIDNTMLIAGPSQILCIELPENIALRVSCDQPNVDLLFDECDMGALWYDIQGDIEADDCSIGAVANNGNEANNRMTFRECNIGALKLFGYNTDLFIDDSNIGAFMAEEDFSSIEILDSSIGACSWSQRNHNIARCSNSIISSSIPEGSVNITISDTK